MQSLTRIYFLELGKKYPEAVDNFLGWLTKYSVDNNLDDIFGNDGKIIETTFFDIPYDMQEGIIHRYDIEKNWGKSGYVKIKRREADRWNTMFAHTQMLIDNNEIKNT